VREAGYRVVYQPAARLWHKVSRSTGAESDLTLYYMRRNVLLYLGEHGARPFLGRLAALTDDLRLAAVWTLRGEHRRRRVLLRAVADYARGRFGKSRSAFT
jgi:GT2 family glycosyltransferase